MSKLNFKDEKAAKYHVNETPEYNQQFKVIAPPFADNLDVIEETIRENSKKIWYWMIIVASLFILYGVF